MPVKNNDELAQEVLVAVDCCPPGFRRMDHGGQQLTPTEDTAPHAGIVAGSDGSESLELTRIVAVRWKAVDAPELPLGLQDSGGGPAQYHRAIAPALDIVRNGAGHRDHGTRSGWST